MNEEVSTSWPSNASGGGEHNDPAESLPSLEHWLKYQSPRPEIHYAMGTMLVLIGTTGALGNSLVLFVFTRFRRLRGPASSFIVNLAIADLCNSLLHSMAAASSFKGKWSFGRTGCVIYAFGVGYFGLLSIVTLAAIAIERYMVITAKPFSGNWKITQYGARKVCVVVWLYCLLMSVPPLFGWSSYVTEGFQTSCSWDYLTRTPSNRAYYVYLLTLGFVLPVGVIAYCYTFILAAIYQHGKEMDAVKRVHESSGYYRGGKTKASFTASNSQHATSTSSRHASAAHNSTFKTAEIILRLVVCFLISWTPYSIVSCIGQFGNLSLVTPWSVTMSALFAKASVVYNPIIYGLSHPHFRSSIKTYLSSFNAAPSNNTAMLRPNSPTAAPTAAVTLRVGNVATSAVAHRSQISVTRFSNHQSRHMQLRYSGSSVSGTRDFVSDPGDPLELQNYRFVNNRIQQQQVHNQPHLTLHHVTLHWQNNDADAVSSESDENEQSSGVVCSSGPSSRYPPPRAICVVYEGGSVCCHVTKASCSSSLGQLPKSGRKGKTCERGVFDEGIEEPT
ncbi:rhodopsin-like [Neocloeon triangulifer]|uniref:rhodopsin-like n=1 Tax=Neocloeon triangulifer TaxID=2078957 RepID=UPI00286F6397|nr:rhodopsin-like [Neocloeon triangulifer]XP_059469046.1 rhodopsin-like [Neocloeon triangulifer]